MGRAALFATSGLVAAGLCLGAPTALAGPSPTGPAKHWVRAELRHRHLTPQVASCRGGKSRWSCFWRAGHEVNGWPFRCRGRAQRRAGVTSISRCNLLGPRYAPTRLASALGNWQPDFGFNDDWTTVYPHVDLLGGVASNTSRVPIRWDTVESSRGHYDFSSYDRIYNAMVYRGVRPILAFDGAPCWARPGTPCVLDSHYPPAPRFYDQWAQFIQVTIRRYPRLEGVEVWNEPNLNVFWQPAPDPVAYTNLLRVTYKAVKAVQPTLPVIFAGLVPQFVPSARAMSVKAFQRRAFKAGAGRYIDAFGVHPYVFPNDDPNLYTAVLRQMAIPKGIMAKFGYPGKPEWVTEFGISSAGAGAVSQPEQAKKIVGLYELLRSIPDVPVLILHRLLDLGPGNTDWQAGMGVATYTGALKPSYCALADARTGHCPY